MNFKLIAIFFALGSSSFILSNTTTINSPEQHAACFNSDKPFIVLYTDPIRCDPCRKTEPVFKRVSNSYPDIGFYIVNASAPSLQSVLQRMLIQSIPTMVFGYNNKVVTRSFGKLTETELKNKITSFRGELFKCKVLSKPEE